MSDEIFLINHNGSLSPLSKQPYPLESDLQELLAKYPEVMSGGQIDPQEPRRWLLVTRELGVPDAEASSDRWSLDHLFLDQDGIPTLVEVKRSSDTRLRREVVGQMLDYAANAVLHWSLERIQSEFAANCERLKADPDDTLEEFLAESVTIEDFWQSVKRNLQSGTIRMLFVADSVPLELRRVVEFLNKQMDPAEVLAIELPQYSGSGLRTLVPKVIGITAESATRKRSDYRWQASKPEDLWAQFERNTTPEELAAARRIHQWLIDKTGNAEPTANGFIVYLPDVTRTRFLFKLAAPGFVAVWFSYMKNKPPFSDRALRLELARRLNSVPGIKIPLDKLEGHPKIPISAFRDSKTLEGFLAVMDWALDQIKNAKV